MKKGGFTLIELMIGVLFYTILIGVTMLVFVVVVKEWSSAQVRSDLRQSAVFALQRISRELGEAREITSAQDNSVSFWWQDSDSDGLRDSAEVITFSWDGTEGGELKRQDVNLAFDVKDFQLTYTDPNNSSLSPSPDLSLADRDSIRRVDVRLKLEMQNEEFTILSSVIPRNLRQVRGPW